MQCNHGVISLAHRLEGCLQINGEWLSMDGGFGYVETDWGSSFPDGYLWTQANFVDHGPSSVMLSVAEIPILNTRFTGSIAAILHRGKCYRLATYSGASLLRCSAEQTILKQGGLSLQVTCLAQTPHLLYAPSSGDMNRLIRESPSCPVRYRFRQGEHLLFDRVCQHASFERVSKQKKAQSL